MTSGRAGDILIKCGQAQVGGIQTSTPSTPDKYTDLAASLTIAFQVYMAVVQSGTFPAEENSIPWTSPSLKGCDSEVNAT